MYEHTYISMLPQHSHNGKFNVENLYEKFGHLILNHEADLWDPDSPKEYCRNEEYKV